MARDIDNLHEISDEKITPELNRSGNRRGMVRNLQKGGNGNKPPTEVRILLVEQGSTGLKAYGGFVSEAYLGDYAWPAVSPLYTRLRRSDPEMLMIGAAFSAWATNTSIVVDLPDKPSDAEKKYQDFIYSVFDDVEGGFGALVETMVRRVPFDGFYVWEAVPGIRTPGWVPPPGAESDGKVWPDLWRSEYDDGLIGIRRFSPRDTSTFLGWVFDGNKRARAMIQQDFPNPSVTLPLNRCLHMVYGDSNNPEGMSPLEGVARLERLKYGYEVVMGIGSEHVAGYLNVQKTQTGSLTEADKTNIANAARAILSAQEGNYALWPFGMEGEVKDISFAAAASILETIKYYSVTKLAVYMMQFIAYNIFTRTGALASATDSSQIAVFTFNSMMDGFASQLDEQIGQRLFEWNKNSFPGLDRRPHIRFKHIEKNVELIQMGQFFRSMAGILPLGDEDYKAIRQKTGFMPRNLPNVAIPPAPAAGSQRPVTNPPNVQAAMARWQELTEESESQIYQALADNDKEEKNEEKIVEEKKAITNINVNMPEIKLPAQESVNLTVNTPDIHVTNQIPEMKVPDVNVPDVNVTVTPPVVNIDNKQPDTHVNISPAPVTIENKMPAVNVPDINVQVSPTPVNVQNVLPETKITVQTPQVNIENQVSPQPVNVQVNPTPVMVENTIQEKEINVQVNPTPVTVENIVNEREVNVNINPTPVTVENKLGDVSVSVNPTPVTIENQIPELALPDLPNITVNVNPTPVTIENKQDTPTVNINVNPTPITVDNTVNVPETPPPTVNITNEIKPKDKKRKVKVDRDIEGNITGLEEEE